ncbi:hypothetical protein [Rhizobium terrae]|uniref:hypothetical protein n=1 Tax=Rhizobium terrae TaxID=2171756 RepID=UPI000E3CA3BD|nr:hypothetical protein [Rhizobium terrae]
MGLLSTGFGSIEKGRGLQNDFEIEYAFQRFAIEKNIAEFTLVGLRPPAIVTDWSYAPFYSDASAAEGEVVIIFQERLDERIGSLSGNHALMRQHWEILERTHDFRLQEYLEPTLCLQILRETADLVTALTGRAMERAGSILAERLQRRCDIVNGRPPKVCRPRLHLVPRAEP